MSDDDAFIATIVDNPGYDLPRLVYADWLDDRSDPRGAYLRAEFEAVLAGSKAVLAIDGLDAEWVARVSRPPRGVCCDHVRFVDCSIKARPVLSAADLDWLEKRFQFRLPADYRAFLRNYNGGRPIPDNFRHDLINERFGLPLPDGYYGSYLLRSEFDEGPAFGTVCTFPYIWQAADSVPDNTQATGWGPDLVENLQLLESWRTGQEDWTPGAYWREGTPADLIWIGDSVDSGMHEVYCLGVRGEAIGRVYHTPVCSDHGCECEDCLLIAPSFAAFLSLLAEPSP